MNDLDLPAIGSDMDIVPVIDTHCHLNILEEKGMPPALALHEAQNRGLDAVIQIATDLKSSIYNRDLSSSWNSEDRGIRLYWTAGLHPESADELQTLDELFSLIKEARNDPWFMGIGETGLDYFHTTKFEKQQKESFDAHLALAAELNLPVILHLRDAKSYSPEQVRSVHDALEMIKNHPGVRGVLHCYTYGPEEAKPFLDLGWYVSFSGILTYKNAEIIQKAASEFPLDRILVETDAPFLTPVPNRGKVNQPAYTEDTLSFLAEIRNRTLGEDQESVRSAVYENSNTFINLKNKSENAYA